MAEKQVAPPFGGIKQVSGSDETVATVPPDDTEPSSSEPLVVVEQTPREASSNTSEYWSSGTIGGLALGNKSNPFGPAPVNPKNPFTRSVASSEAKPSETVMFDVPDGTPSWRELVGFVVEHGKDINGVRYPNPPRNAEVATQGWSTVIDTVWKGVPVWNGERCEIRHSRYGWTSWEDCQS